MSGLNPIYTTDQLQLLDLVDELRAQGLSAILPLPQLIVCGDQSSGKSSVLEALSGVPFPSKENLCTRFATEVMLRRTGERQTIRVSISVSPERPSAERQQLEGFSRSLNSVGELPALIERVKDALGVGLEGKTFAKDVLRLEVTSPTVPQLTIVDLPGLIHSGTGDEPEVEPQLISNLVGSYMEQTRSIVLAVVSAKNDYANQIVLQRARQVDPHGFRTLGIITKPDKLACSSEAEKEFIQLAQNSVIKFKLGWHVVRNLDSSSESRSNLNRDQIEREFFESGNWKSLDPATMGISALLRRLPEVLFGQIRAELPSLVQDIKIEEASCRSRLLKMGRSRSTEQDQQQYLLETAQKFQQLAKAGIDGDYGDPSFGHALSDSGVPRMRAIVQNGNEDFEEKVSSRKGSSINLPTEDDEMREAAVERVMQLMRASRGRELPGTFNPLLIGELFREYSSSWVGYAESHVREICRQASIYLTAVLKATSAEEVCEKIEHHILNSALNELYDRAENRLKVLLEELRYHAITYNHYFTDTVVKLQNKRSLRNAQRLMATRLDKFFSREMSMGREDAESIFSELFVQPEPNMTKAAAENILDHMLAFYKTSFKRFVDDVAIQVIETEILVPLSSVFTPSTVAQLSAADISLIASEPESNKARRSLLETRLSMLENCLKKVQLHTSSKDLVLNAGNSHDGSNDTDPKTASVDGRQSSQSEGIEHSRTPEEAVDSPTEAFAEPVVLEDSRHDKKGQDLDDFRGPNFGGRSKKSKKKKSVLDWGGFEISQDKRKDWSD